MKLKIKVKRIYNNIELPSIIKKGEWIDLRASETIKFNAPQAGTLKKHKVGSKVESHRDVEFDSKLISLGVAMKLPKGFEAILVSRSSTYKNFGVILANGKGIIDNSYCGNNDEWKYNAIAFRDTVINTGDRVCQFRIQLSQKATMWNKIRWFLSSGIKLVEVDNLGDIDRGGIGSTGIK